MTIGHLLSNLLPLESVQLGRLVLDAKRPQQDFIDPFADRPTATEFSRNPQSPFEETCKFSRVSKLRSYLSDVLSFSYERQNLGAATLSAPLATTHDLMNSGAWFDSACTQPETRRFLERAIDNQSSVYLIVGFRTVQDARLVKNVTWKTGQVAKGEIPVQLIATSIAPANVVTNIAAPGVGCIRDVGNGQVLTFRAPGEQVFAVMYRKVRFKWLSSRYCLEANNRWASCWDWRRADNEDDDEEDDVIEANLTDVSDLDSEDEEYDSEDETSLQEELSGLGDMEDIKKDYGVLEGILGSGRTSPELRCTTENSGGDTPSLPPLETSPERPTPPEAGGQSPPLPAPPETNSEYKASLDSTSEMSEYSRIVFLCFLVCVCCCLFSMAGF